MAYFCTMIEQETTPWNVFEDIIQISNEETSDESTYFKAILKDLWICMVSREASLLARKEVLGGKAKFGITGDGKELPQVVLSRFFKKGDFRSGYYRDQTLAMAQGLSTVQQFFAQLYADPDNDPFSGGRQMNNHFASPFIDEEDAFLDLTERYNHSSDISPTGGQMARALGLALASKKFRTNHSLHAHTKLTRKGDEVVYCTIGDASTSEGVFWETMNAAAVLQVPLVVSVWDDGYGISVPKELQTAKGSISKACSGFLKTDEENGIYIYNVKGWDYVSLINVYDEASRLARKEHVPILIHVEELTQPQGHSTSGSHERYKSEDRLAWEKEYDCIEKMTSWVVETGISSNDEIALLKQAAKNFVKAAKRDAWKSYSEPNKMLKKQIIEELQSLPDAQSSILSKHIEDLQNSLDPSYSELLSILRQCKIDLFTAKQDIPTFINETIEQSAKRAKKQYEKHLYSESDKAAVNQAIISAEYAEEASIVNGFQLINSYFDQLFERDPRTYAFGEDVGHIGDVNQGFAGLQEKYGIDRIFDTGIREWTIIGQAIGMSMRGLRPIAEIQYLDYLIYALSPLSDDLATLRYRSNGIQMAPAIIRTRGHRLEGIWHSGSHMGMVIHSLRGMCICVPRNFTQAAGMYQTLMQSTDPALVIEPLAGYRLKERMPSNIGEYTVPLGVPDILTEGNDITIVSYGTTLRIVEKAVNKLASMGINAELIDLQTFLPFDLENVIRDSVEKTNRLLIVDEDVPGGGSGFILQQLLEERDVYYLLDSQPRTLTAKDHRPPFGDTGDYFSKPNAEDVIETVLEMILEAEPDKL